MLTRAWAAARAKSWPTHAATAARTTALGGNVVGEPSGNQPIRGTGRAVTAHHTA